MAKAKTARTPKTKAETTETNVLQMPTNGNGNGAVPADLESEIRLRAYELFEQRGCTPGFEEQDWIEAEREVLSRYAEKSHTA